MCFLKLKIFVKIFIPNFISPCGSVKIPLQTDLGITVLGVRSVLDFKISQSGIHNQILDRYLLTEWFVKLTFRVSLMMSVCRGL